MNYISAFAEDAQGLIWMTSVQGLIVLDAEKKSSRQFRLEQGLPSLKTSGVLVDSINRIWFGTSNGLCMLDAARHHVYRFDENDGLPTTYFYEGPAQRLSNGNFAFSSYQGLVIFKPENIMTVKSTVPVYLTGFRLYGKDNDKIGSSLETKELSLKHDQNYFNLEITGLYFNNPSHLRYAYKLDGFDKDWHYSSDRHINYTNVPGGKYTFRFKAGVQTELDNAPERQLTLLIGTVFYKTWWFIALVIGIIALLVYLYIRNKFLQQSQIYLLENRAESLEKEKAMVMYENLQQQLNPHFLFNSLTSLRSLIKINPAEAGQFLDRMSSIYRYILQNRDKELVTLKEEMQFVQSFIDLQRKRFGEGLNVQVKIPEADLGFKVVPVTLQNLIENAIKHNRVDEESPLLLEIYTENDFLVVRNNLQKKEFVESSNRQGLKNLKVLYEYLDERPVQVIKEGNYFIVRVPLVV